MEKGFCDMVIGRKNLRRTIGKLLAVHERGVR